MTTTPHYYNTNHEEGEVLQQSVEKAKNQEDIVLDFFRKNPDKSFTPFDLQYNEVFDDSVPITSIRRAITNLCKKKLLEKTVEKREGCYGKDNYCWRLYVPKAPKEYVQGNLF